MHYVNYILTILKRGIPVGVQKSQEYILKQSHTTRFLSIFSRLHVSYQS
jgi:hypothetical protein